MAIPIFSNDLAIISKLSDYPGSGDGLTTEQFKAKFDESGLALQNYINNTLIPGIESSVSEKGLLSQIAAQLATKLSLSGGSMTGALNMSGRRLYNIPTPTDKLDAANKSYVDTAIETAKTATKTFRKTVTLTAAGWSASAPYTQSITVDGLTDTLFAKTYPDFPENAAQDEAFREETAKITSCKRNGSTVTYRCALEKPETDIPVVVEVST